MVPLVAKLLAAGAALGLALFATSKSNASPAPSSSASTPPPELLDAIVNAVASRDPAVMRAVATKLDAMGFTKQAADLRRTADEAAALAKKTPATSTARPRPAATPAPAPSSSALPVAERVPLVSPGTSASPEQVLAAKVALNLQTTAAGREDANLLKAYQKQEGLVQDGKYGPKSALGLVKYGIVPAVPRAWPKGQEAAARKLFAAAMRAEASRDTTRAEEWLQAAILAEGKGGAVKGPLGPRPVVKAADYTSDPDALAKKMAQAAGFATGAGPLGIGFQGEGLV